MRFIDNDIFIYALSAEKKGASDEEMEKKSKAAIIMENIDNGEKVATSTAHIFELIRILEKKWNKEMAQKFAMKLLTHPHIEVFGVDLEVYIMAVSLADKHMLSIKYALEYLLMKENGIDEIYTFDPCLNALGVKLKSE